MEVIERGGDSPKDDDDDNGCRSADNQTCRFWTAERSTPHLDDVIACEPMSAAGDDRPTVHRTQWQPAIQGGIDVIRLESLELSAIHLAPGAYAVTISMDRAAARDFGSLPPCAGFPAELMSRDYDATMALSSHSGADRALSLEGPTVFSNSQLDLLIGNDSIAFEMESPFTTELAGFRYLNILGFAPTDEPVTVSEAAITVPFNALFQYCELNSPAKRGWENCQHVAADQMVQFHACASNSARMVFTKR